MARPLRTLLAALSLALLVGAGCGLPAAAGRREPLGREPAPPATPRPFGRLDCLAKYGVRFCQGNGTTERVPSFDGVPLDADVTLPAKGRGPFPLIVMLHGLASSKQEYEATSDDGQVDNVTFARHGWAVLTYTARGFGDSCGTAASRNGTPACARGWLHLADQRYEVRDTQYLAGLLVDEGLVKPRIAVTGVSYGGGQSLELAMLKNRIRLRDGRFAPWVSPRYRVPMSVGAVYAEWGWDDLVSALVPNGALSASGYTRAEHDIVPVGVEKQSWDDLLYDATALYYLAPSRADPSADLTGWHAAIDGGEPYSGQVRGYLDQLEEYHSPIGIPMPKGGPAPVVMQNGWTDTLFPVSEALHFAAAYGADHVRAPLLQIFDDVGHGWAQDKAADVTYQTKLAISFLDDEMLTRKRPETGVVAIGTTCPKSIGSGPRLSGPFLSSLVSRTVAVSAPAAQVVTSNGGSPTVARALDPAYASSYCDPLPGGEEAGSALYTLLAPAGQLRRLLGAVAVSCELAVTGDYPELVARLWDLDPASGKRQLVAAAVDRPDIDQGVGASPHSRGRGEVSFDLSPNFWTLPAGHLLELELVGRSAPWFRPSNGRFRISVTHLVAKVPLAR